MEAQALGTFARAKDAVEAILEADVTFNTTQGIQDIPTENVWHHDLYRDLME